MLAGLWPSPIVEVASAIVAVVVVGLLRLVFRLAERVARLEGIVERLNGGRRSGR